MLLLAAELLSIVVCLGSAQGEVSAVDSINGLAYHKLYGVMRASVAV